MQQKWKQMRKELVNLKMEQWKVPSMNNRWGKSEDFQDPVG